MIVSDGAKFGIVLGAAVLTAIVPRQHILSSMNFKNEKGGLGFSGLVTVKFVSFTSHSQEPSSLPRRQGFEIRP